MKRSSILATFLTTAAFATSAFAATSTFVIPTAGTTEGANGSVWRTELGVHSAAGEEVQLDFTFLNPEREETRFFVRVPANATLVGANTLEERGITAELGALLIQMDSRYRDKIALTSRSINESETGHFGQYVPVYSIEDDALSVGDTAALIGPADAASYRFNAGVFSVTESEIEWQLVRGDGTIAATRTVSYENFEPVRYNTIVSNFFGETPMDDDAVRARILSGTAIPYGSIIDNRTGDPSWVAPLVVRENIAPIVEGIDLDEDGDIELADFNGDGIIDNVMEIVTSNFPNYFRIIAEDVEGQPLSIQFVSHTEDIKTIDDGMTVQWAPGVDVKGTSTVLELLVSDGIDATTVRIPVLFQ